MIRQDFYGLTGGTAAFEKYQDPGKVLRTKFNGMFFKNILKPTVRQCVREFITFNQHTHLLSHLLRKMHNQTALSRILTIEIENGNFFLSSVAVFNME